MNKTIFSCSLLFVGILVSSLLFNISCKNKTTTSINLEKPNNDNFTLLEVIPSNEDLLYNVEILQDRKLLEKFEGQKGKFQHKTNIEAGHRVTLNAVYQEESKENIMIRISKNGKLLKESFAKRGALGMAYILQDK